MRTKNFKSIARRALSTLGLILLASFLFFSCKKDARPVKSAGYDTNEIARILKGNRMNGSLSINSDQTDWEMDLDSGSRYIFIQKLPGNENVNIRSMPAAEVVTSVYGVVIKDTERNKTLFFINKDEESIKKFEAIQSILPATTQRVRIFGITVVNAEKS